MVGTRSSVCILRVAAFLALVVTSSAVPRGRRSVFLDVSADRALHNGARANPLGGVLRAVKRTAKDLVADASDKLVKNDDVRSGPPPTQVLEMGKKQVDAKEEHDGQVKKRHRMKNNHTNADTEPWLDMDDLEAYVKGAVGKTTARSQLSSHSKSKSVTSGVVGTSLHRIKGQEEADDRKQTLADALRAAAKTVENNTQTPAVPNVTCEPGMEGCKSLCWWLKMTDKDRSASCPLFERPLVTCGYPGYVAGTEGTVANPLDCTVELVRKTVFGGDVDYYVAELESCVASLPVDVNATCRMPLSLLRAEISDWKTEVSLKARAQIIGKQLLVAITEAKAALESMTNQEESIDQLSNLLKTAEELPGHYLAEKIRTARAYLDKLAPIPAVRKELQASLSDGRRAMSQQGLFAVNAAIIWMRSAIHKAERVELGEPLPIAQHLLEDLTKLKSVLLELQDATFDGNVSLGTKSEMPQAIQGLKSALAQTAGISAEHGLEKAIGVANTVLTKLEEMEEVVEALENNTEQGQKVLNVPGYKGRVELQEAVVDLNSTIHHADELDMDDRAETSSALETLDNLTYDLNARNALHSAVQHGRHVLSVNRSSPTDDAEEEAIALLEPAIAWGEEVGLHNGLPVAHELVQRLKDVESAKEGMMQALVQGNLSLTATTGEEEAIRGLGHAIAVYTDLGISGGTAEARHQLQLLAARRVARSTLERATEMANTSLTTRTGEDDAIDALNASIAEAERVGLGADASIANQTLEQLEEFAVVDHQLQQALARTTPEPPPTTTLAPEVADPEVGVNVTFNRTGVRTVHLPDIAVAHDDGDDNFTEHINALEHAIEEGREEGVVDPQMQRQIRQLRSRQSAHDMMEAAIAQGELATDNKTGIINAIVNLTAATKEAEESGLTLDVPRAEELLQQLNTIKPARDEMYEAIVQANVSIRTVSGMDVALARLNAAISVCQTLDLTKWIPRAESVRDELTVVRATFMHLRAAVMQGEIALEAEQGEEAAITELEQAIDEADRMDMHKHMEIAVDLMHELAHMNAEHQRMQAAITPNIPR